MTFDDYQRQAARFARYPTTAGIEYYDTNDVIVFEDTPYLYPALALAEEVGEVSGKIAKYVRKQEYNVNTYLKLQKDVEAELGDVLWQLAALAKEFNLSLQDIAYNNLAKLEGRETRGVIVGEGDSR